MSADYEIRKISVNEPQLVDAPTYESVAQSDTSVYDIIQLGPGTSWVTDGTTINTATQSDMTLMDPVTTTDGNGDDFLGVGDVMNGSTIVSVGKFGGRITHDDDASMSNATGFFFTTDVGNT